MPFRDRQDAGKLLAAALASFKKEGPVVLALPRGGVPVASEVAEELAAPLDLVLVRKIGVPPAASRLDWRRIWIRRISLVARRIALRHQRPIRRLGKSPVGCREPR